MNVFKYFFLKQNLQGGRKHNDHFTYVGFGEYLDMNGRLVSLLCSLVLFCAWVPMHTVAVPISPSSGNRSAGGFEDAHSPIHPQGCGGRHTLVIGAGAAGLAAAHFLRAHNCSVTVVEGRSRIGGRTYSSDASGIEDRVFEGIDRGGHWVHGGRNNPIATSYLDYFAIPRLAVGGDSTYEGEREKLCAHSEHDQSWLSAQQVDSSFDLFAYQMALTSIYYWQRRRLHPTAADISVAQGIARANKRFHLNMSKWSREALGWHHTVKFQGDEAARGSELSLREAMEASYHDFYPDHCDSITNGGRCHVPDGDEVIVGGYSSLIQALARDLGGVEIHLNTTVTAVRTSDTGVDVMTNSDNGMLSILKADHVIVTLPLGLLKNMSSSSSSPTAAIKVQILKRQFNSYFTM